MCISKKDYTWNTIDESFWQSLIVELTPFNIEKYGSIIRIREDGMFYENVVKLRYEGLVESGFIKATEWSDYNQMRLERDRESIILGYQIRNEIVATMTLNSPSVEFPGMAMLLEKGFACEHSEFTTKNSIEICKFVIDKKYRNFPGIFMFILVPMLIGYALSKSHFWQVVKDCEKDLRFRTRMGFTIFPKLYIDQSLNNMPSYIGYFNLYELINNPLISKIQRDFVEKLIKVD
jgi:hypothetical protein